LNLLKTKLMNKLVIFHPAIAPYRIDFFNSLNDTFDASFYFLHKNALEQSFDQVALRERLSFSPKYLSPGLFGLKNLRLGVFSILKKERPHIVFCSEYNMLGLFVLFHKWLFNRRIKVITICDDSKEIAENVKIKQKIVRYFLVKKFDGIILANQSVINWYKVSFPKESRKIIFFPIIQEDNNFRMLLKNALPKSKIYANNLNLKYKRIILYVGRLAVVKNLDLLINSFFYVHKKDSSCVLLIVGEGENYNHLLQRTKELDISDNVFFLGKKQGEDLFSLYNIGQIFVLPSIYEPFGAVVNEALLAGCNTLCSSIAGASDLIYKNENGYLFNPYDIKDLINKLEIELSSTTKLDKIEVKVNKMHKSYANYYQTFINDLKSLLPS